MFEIEHIKNPDVRNLALVRLGEFVTEGGNPEDFSQSFGFDWSTTPEGEEYWDSVLNGGYESMPAKTITLLGYERVVLASEVEYIIDRLKKFL